MPEEALMHARTHSNTVVVSNCTTTYLWYRRVATNEAFTRSTLAGVEIVSNRAVLHARVRPPSITIMGWKKRSRAIITPDLPKVVAPKFGELVNEHAHEVASHWKPYSRRLDLSPA